MFCDRALYREIWKALIASGSEQQNVPVEPQQHGERVLGQFIEMPHGPCIDTAIGQHHKTVLKRYSANRDGAGPETFDYEVATPAILS